MVVRGLSATLILVAAIIVASCAGPDPEQPEASTIARLLPSAAEFSGWTVSDGPTEYVPDTLYEYLNGGAERYEALGFQILVHMRYQHGDDALACVTLDVYDMGSDLGAFGIYSAGKPVDRQHRSWGAEGYRIGPIAAAYKGSIFIHGEADDDRPELVEMLEILMLRVTDAAEGSMSPPAIFASLPADHRSPGSKRYVPKDLLGHSFLPGGVLATYEIDDRQAELFLSDLGTEDRADDAMRALRSHFEKRDTLSGTTPNFGADGFRTTDPIFGQATVVRTANLIAGIQGDLAIEEREEILRQLITAAE